jgi:hypothetical protein
MKIFITLSLFLTFSATAATFCCSTKRAKIQYEGDLNISQAFCKQDGGQLKSGDCFSLFKIKCAGGQKMCTNNPVKACLMKRICK